MIRYKETEELPVMAFTPDADYPVIFSEKRLVNLKLTRNLQADSAKWTLAMAKGGNVVNQVPDSAQLLLQRGEEQIHLQGKGMAAHGSVPEIGENAIDDLMKKLTQHSCFAECSETLKAFAAFYMEHLYASWDGRGFDVCCNDRELGRSTFNTALLYGDEEKIQLTLDCRFPASLDVETPLQKMKEAGERSSILVEVVKNKPGLFMPKDHPLVETLQKVYEVETGERCAPIAIGGGTYAKTLPNTVAFGPIFPGCQNRIHETDEFITVDELMKDAGMITRAMCELAGSAER